MFKFALKSRNETDMIDQDVTETEDADLVVTGATVGNVVLFCAVFSTAVTLLWKYLPDSALPFAKTSLIGFALVMLLRIFLSLLLPVLFFAFRYKLEDVRILGRNPGLGAILLSVLIGCPLSLILVSIHNLIVRLFIARGIALTFPAFFYVSSDTSLESRLLALFAAFLIPVLLQELFFRGLLFSVWPGSAARPLRILLSGFLFALFMQNPIDFIPLLLLGIVLAYVRQSTDNFLCPVLTQISMLLTYYLFSKLLPYTDYFSATVTNDTSLVSVYVAAAALVMSLLAFLPVLAQLRRISVEKERIDLIEDEKETVSDSIRGQFSWSFFLGLILFAVNWVQLLGI